MLAAFLSPEILLLLQVLVVLGAIFIGVRLGGIAIGYAGGIGLIILSLFLGMDPGGITGSKVYIAIDVILIIMSVIAAIAAMQVAGGLDYLVHLAERILRKNPKYITFLGPTVTYFLTIFAGTGHTAFSALPVIAEVAKEQGVKPSVPLSVSVVASQIAITASPVSAAVIWISSDMALGQYGVGYLTILAICIPTTFVACMITAFICNLFDTDLSKDIVYQERLKEGLIKFRGETQFVAKKGAKLSVLLFLIGIIAVVLYASAISPATGWITNPVAGRDAAIIMFMLTIATLISIFCKIETAQVLNASTFKSGMTACVCVLGVAWLGTTFVQGHIEGITTLAGNVLYDYPWLLAVALFFASMLLYSQAATAKAILPVAIALNAGGVMLVEPSTMVASFAAVSALFVLPTYPTLLAAVQMDDTGSTRIGKYVFNHPFLFPGVLAIAIAVTLGFIIAPIFI
ncbi:MAG: anaerobic C4-dicarboxylate transporter [Campylobacteraceae bacterium]|jgi:anaerobic C4-dicarboxylate transporter DcuA|nr:anaerobic C4-dicarboxylate transporter [Campylobacteraceae bacterium]